MSLPVAIQSAIFYYLACTPCNEMKAFRRAKKKAKEDREFKRKIEMEQPGLYRHPDPFNTNPFWAEEMAAGPHLAKKSGGKNSSQRGLASAGRTSTVASFGNASTIAESTSPATPITSAEPGRDLSGDAWDRALYQREDEELWGHNLTGMGHKLMDNIAKAGNSAGRYVEVKLGRDKSITDEDRDNFYRTPRNPPVNEYHPPIVGSRPSRPDALKWMLQPPPPAKLMEGRVPVERTASISTAGSRGTVPIEEHPVGRLVREKALKKVRPRDRSHLEETPSESELIDSLIGGPSRRTTVSSKGRSNRSRSLSLESEPSSDGELVERRRIACARRIPITLVDSSDDEDNFTHHRACNSLAEPIPPGPPKPAATRRSGSRSHTRQALKARPNGTKPSAAANDDSDLTPKASANPVVTLESDENTPTRISHAMTASRC